MRISDKKVAKEEDQRIINIIILYIHFHSKMSNVISELWESRYIYCFCIYIYMYIYLHIYSMHICLNIYAYIEQTDSHKSIFEYIYFIGIKKKAKERIVIKAQ